MQGYFSRASLSLAIVGLLMAGTASAQIGNADKCGIKPSSPAPAPKESVQPSGSEYNSGSGCKACCVWDCARIKCLVEKIKCKTEALLKSERCSRVRNRCLFEAVVALNTELCKLSKCECLSPCEIERIISCIESKVCDLEKIVKRSCNRTWICLVREIKCLVGELRQCKKSEENGQAPV